MYIRVWSYFSDIFIVLKISKGMINGSKINYGLHPGLLLGDAPPDLIESELEIENVNLSYKFRLSQPGYASKIRNAKLSHFRHLINLKRYLNAAKPGKAEDALGRINYLIPRVEKLETLFGEEEIEIVRIYCRGWEAIGPSYLDHKSYVKGAQVYSGIRDFLDRVKTEANQTNNVHLVLKDMNSLNPNKLLEKIIKRSYKFQRHLVKDQKRVVESEKPGSPHYLVEALLLNRFATLAKDKKCKAYAQNIINKFKTEQSILFQEMHKKAFYKLLRRKR